MKRDLTTFLAQNGPSLASLDDGALMTVLLRTRASDHSNLRLTCKRIRDIIDSVQFRKERSIQGFAEVRVALLSPFEQYQQNHYGKNPPTEHDPEFFMHYNDFGYKREYGDHSFETKCFRVFVDGRPLHKLKKVRKAEFMLNVRLVPLQAPFWKVCGRYSQALYDLGTSLFTNKGKPKIASLKDALARYDGPFLYDLLYIDDFYVPFEYRTTASIVGPSIIKQVLEIFDELYSIAMYIPFRVPQFTKEDAEADKARDRYGRYEDEKTDEDIQAEEELKEHNEALTQQDMRQFFRAGFYQVDEPDIVETSDYSYVFTTPVDAEEPILAVDEVMKRPIARKTPPRPEPRGLARQLRLLVKRTTLELNEKKDGIKKFREPPSHNPLFRSLFDAKADRLQQLRDQEDELTVSIQQRTMTHMEVSGLEEARGKVRSARIDFERSFDQNCGEIHAHLLEAAVSLEAKLEIFTGEVREEVKVLVEKSESRLQTILDSDVIHLTAAGDHMDLLRMIVDLLPAPERIAALNGLDRVGLTPLMVVAGMGASRDVIEFRQTLEALIAMGADKNIVHTSKGLSAFGYFRDVCKKADVSRKIFGFPGLSAELQAEVSRIEALLRPANGPTPADDAIVEAKDESDSDFDDQSDF